MVKSKGWGWNLADKSQWLEPCEESYYYTKKWKKEGVTSILDLGCGVGRHAILFAKEGFKVTALDISKEGLDYLEHWKKKENLDIVCEVGDMKQLPFSNNTFDCIWSYHVISHTDSEGIKQIIRELKRVLKPSGRIFLTLCSKESWTYKEAHYEYIDENTIVKTEPPEKDVPHFFVNLEDIEQLFYDFEMITVRHIDDCYFGGHKQTSRHYFIEIVSKKEEELDYSDVIGRNVCGTVDRPMGTCHPTYTDLVYPINYGYVDGIFAADGEEQDVYILGVSHPLKKFEGTVIAVYHRYDDIEDKWIVAPAGMNFSDEEILEAIRFQEKYFDGKLYR